MGRPVNPPPVVLDWHRQAFADNQHIVYQIVRRLGGKWRAKLAGCEFDDLLQAGMIGLWRAILRYDATKGIKVRTLASKAIIGEVLEALDKARFGTRKRSHLAPKMDQSRYRRLPDAL